MQNTTAAAPAPKTSYSLLWDESAIIDDKAKDLLESGIAETESEAFEMASLDYDLIEWELMISRRIYILVFLPKGSILSRAKIWATASVRLRLLSRGRPRLRCQSLPKTPRTLRGQLTAAADHLYPIHYDAPTGIIRCALVAQKTQ